MYHSNYIFRTGSAIIFRWLSTFIPTSCLKENFSTISAWNNNNWYIFCVTLYPLFPYISTFCTIYFYLKLEQQQVAHIPLIFFCVFWYQKLWKFQSLVPGIQNKKGRPPYLKNHLFYRFFSLTKVISKNI